MADFTQLIADTANSYGVSPQLALEVATVESNLNPSAVSPKGAIGIFQLMPATAASLGVNPQDPTQNIQGGIRLLQQLLNRFGDVTEALAAYNWNPASVAAAISKYGANWLTAAPAETQNYVAKIMAGLGTQYSVSIAPPPPPPDTTTAPADGSVIDASMIDPSLIDLSLLAPASTPSGLSSVLVLGILGLLALWIFEEAT